jgi:hypothetical protein
MQDCSGVLREGGFHMLLQSREVDEVKISALSDGGDDYVTKPFSPGVLMAKFKAHLRRVSTGRRERLLELPGLSVALFQFTWGMESMEDTRTVAVHTAFYLKNRG